MEPPFKRQRLAESSYPEADLHARRAQNDKRLKSMFESIFEKYGRDFEGIGDEIDMETGEIVVNNGHIQGMNDERDIGNVEYAFGKLDDSDYEDEHSSTEDSEEYLATVGASKAGGAAVVEELEASVQSDFDADSLMGDVPANSRLHQLGKKSRRAVSIPPNDEEDELASSDIEWVPYNKDRLDAQERFSLLKDKYAFISEPAIDPVWRAPPLFDISRLKMKEEKVGLTNVDDMRECSDDERAGISLWTPELKQYPRRRHDSAKSINQRSLSFKRGQEKNDDRTYLDWSHSEPAHRKKLKWTKEEDELLLYLKEHTTLTRTAINAYFPERQSSSIMSHWYYMVNHGRASLKPQIPTILGPHMPRLCLSSSTSSLASSETRSESCNHDSESKPEKSQTVQQQVNRESQEAASLFQSSSKPIEHPGDHHNSQCQVGGGHDTPNGNTVDESILICDDVGTHIESPTRDPFSTARDYGCKIAESANQVNSNEIYGNADRSYSLFKSLEIQDDVRMREMNSTSKFPNQGPEDLSENGFGARRTSLTTCSKAELGPKGADPRSDGIDSPEVQSRGTAAFEASDFPQQHTRSHPKRQRQEPMRLAAEDNGQRKKSTAERLRKTNSTILDSITPEQPPNYSTSSASYEPNVEETSKNPITRQVLQVVIPLAAKSYLITKRVATMETEDPASIRQLSEPADSLSAALGPNLPYQENIAFRTPTRSPSAAIAESQHATSAVSVLNDVRSSLGPEIADSQPLSTTPVVAPSAPDVGGEATRPIILDAESPPLSMSPSVAPSERRQLEKATKTIILKSDSHRLRVNPGIVTLVRKPIEEATESDVVESGSHPMSRTLSVARSLSKRVKEGTTAEPLTPIWTAIDDYSEDELSYL